MVFYYSKALPSSLHFYCWFDVLECQPKSKVNGRCKDCGFHGNFCRTPLPFSFQQLSGKHLISVCGVCQFEWLLEEDIVKSLQDPNKQIQSRAFEISASYDKFFCKLGILTSPLPEVLKLPICSYAENVDVEFCLRGRLKLKKKPTPRARDLKLSDATLFSL